MEQPPVCRLHAAESVALARALSGQAGDHGLYLGMTGKAAKGLPRMGCWTRLRLVDDQFHGDVTAPAGSLPFADETFRSVVLSHVLEWTPEAAEMLDEAVRVLSPEGLLAIAGFHPFSAWLPWLLCRRRPRPMLTAPGWMRQRLAAQPMQLLQIRRYGAPLPTRHGGNVPAGLGGGFVLVARKRSAAIMKIKPRARREAANRHAAWAPSTTNRECA